MLVRTFCSPVWVREFEKTYIFLWGGGIIICHVVNLSTSPFCPSTYVYLITCLGVTWTQRLPGESNLKT